MSSCCVDRFVDIEEINKTIEIAIHKPIQVSLDLSERISLKPFFDDLLKNKSSVTSLKQKHNIASMRNSLLIDAFEQGSQTNSDESFVRDKLKVRSIKSHSGVVSITVFTAASWIDELTESDGLVESNESKVNNFSCKWNCAYCPNEPGQPRSYLKGEPGVMRANRWNFDCIAQMHDRMTTLAKIGHDVDKLEVLVLGGTWTSYPEKYREQFIRDIYYAANTWHPNQDKEQVQRNKGSLAEERDMNRSQKAHIIGLTLETRPDTITIDEIKRLRHYGCTRVQLGIQHTDYNVLKTIKRGCYNWDAIRAIQMLKDSGFKIDAHWMPNLPGSSEKLDDDMFMKLLGVKKKVYGPQDSQNEEYDLVCPELQVDQWKVYPCTIVPYTEIADWYASGTYVPYSWTTLTDLLIKMKSLMFPWIRLNRIIRDIPQSYSIRTDYKSNMRQDLKTIMDKDGTHCQCIRCREVGLKSMVPGLVPIMTVRSYNASNGIEYFISFENKSKSTIYGFARLRLSQNQMLECLQGCALLRELHVYGKVAVVGSNNGSVQHKGMGKALVAKAEAIAKEKGYKKIAVISGEGVKPYYEKLGYVETDSYMIKVFQVAV